MKHHIVMTAKRKQTSVVKNKAPSKEHTGRHVALQKKSSVYKLKLTNYRIKDGFKSHGHTDLGRTDGQTDAVHWHVQSEDAYHPTNGDEK